LALLLARPALKQAILCCPLGHFLPYIGSHFDLFKAELHIFFKISNIFNQNGIII
jgi:hypothetical protein